MTVSSNGGGLFNLSGAIGNGDSGGTIGVLVDGGVIGLVGSNSFTGDLTISKGSVRASTSGLNGAGVIRLGDGNTGSNAVQLSPNGGVYERNIVVDGSGSGTMKIESAGTIPAISGTSGVFNGDISLGRSLTVNAVGGGMFLNGDISGVGALILGVNGAANAANAHTISGNNSFSGGLQTDGNLLFNIASATAPGTGTWTIGPGNAFRSLDIDIDNTSGGALTLANNNAQNWSSFTFVGSDDMNMGTGGVTILDSQAIITVLNKKLTVGGVISGAAKIVGNGGAGTLELTGANTYTGATFVGGTLAVTSLANGAVASNIGQSSNAAANLVLNRGTLQYTGTGASTDRLFTVGNGGGTIESSGSGALQFDATGAIVSTDTVTFATTLFFTATPSTTISVGSTTSENSTANLAVGQTISGVGIAPGTTITEILNAHQIVISQATTGIAASGSYTFGALDRTLTLSGTNSGINTIAGVLSNSASKTLGVTKSGSGRWILSGTNTYTGATTITAGTLVLSTAGTNNIASSTTITVQSEAHLDVTGVSSGFTLASGQTIGGGGTVVGNLTVATASTLSPGNSPGTLTQTGNQTWLDGGNYNWQVYDAAGLAGSGYDTIVITGLLDLSNLTAETGFNINLWSLSAIGPDVNGNAMNFSETSQSWTLVSTTGGITGFDSTDFSINTSAVNGTGGFSNSFAGTFSVSVSGNDLLLNYTVVPEPGTTALLVAGFSLFALWKRRRFHS